jgi:hypothetical protein
MERGKLKLEKRIIAGTLVADNCTFTSTHIVISISLFTS